MPGEQIAAMIMNGQHLVPMVAYKPNFKSMHSYLNIYRLFIDFKLASLYFFLNGPIWKICEGFQESRLCILRNFYHHFVLVKQVDVQSSKNISLLCS